MEGMGKTSRPPLPPKMVMALGQVKYIGFCDLR